MKLTKNCLYPWNFLQIHAGGMMQCCAVANDTDLGDFIIDHCRKFERGEQTDIFNTPGLVSIRAGLLSGNLRPMCRDCFFIESKLVTTEMLANRVKAHLTKRLPSSVNVESVDLSKTYAYDEIAISFTNKCNMSCVYCIQSTQAKSNPYFKMDFPEKYIESTLDYIAKQGIWRIRSCVEGEPTVYKRWASVFTTFFDKYPHIKARMTTNLAREYTDEEITLLTRYSDIDVSCDTLDPALYARLRRGGNVATVLKNLRRIQNRVAELKIPGPSISIHAVVCDITWPTLQELADYAFDNNMHPVLGNYEERTNSIAFQKQICKPISTMPIEEQKKCFTVISGIAERLAAIGSISSTGTDENIQGSLLQDLSKRVEKNFNRFAPYDDNPLHKAFFDAYPCGTIDMHLDLVYDHDNIAYAGILFRRPGQCLRLDEFAAKHVVLREVACFEPGRSSHKYQQTILPGYRKIFEVHNGSFEYIPTFEDGVAQVLLEVSEYWDE